MYTPCGVWARSGQWAFERRFVTTASESRSTTWRRTRLHLEGVYGPGRRTVTDTVRMALRHSQSALTGDSRDAEAAVARFRSGIHALPSRPRAQTVTLCAWSTRMLIDKGMKVQSVNRRNQCHAPDGPAIVESWCGM